MLTAVCKPSYAPTYKTSRLNGQSMPKRSSEKGALSDSLFVPLISPHRYCLVNTISLKHKRFNHVNQSKNLAWSGARCPAYKVSVCTIIRAKWYNKETEFLDCVR